MNPSLSIQEEYDSLFETLGDAGSAFFKFFDLFRVNLGESDGISKGVHYGKDCSCIKATDDQLKQLKTYLKSQKSWIKIHEKKVSPADCRRRMWFWVQKLKEWNIFDMRTRRDIMYWMDTAMERSMEGSMVRVEYLHGEPVIAKIPHSE